MAIKAAWKLVLKVTERWTAPPNGRPPVFIHEIEGLEGILTEGSTQAVAKVGSGDVQLSGGEAILDLTALEHPSNTTVDMTGKRVRRLVFQARSTNTAAIVITADETNGYDLKLEETLSPGDAVAKAFQTNLAVVSPTAKRVLIESADLDAILDFVIVAG